MKILDQANNNNFCIKNNHLFFNNHKCLIDLGENKPLQYWEDNKIKTYNTGVLFTEYYGYEKIKNLAFWNNNGECLFCINTDNLPFDAKLSKSKADNIHALVFDNGVLVSMRNVDNQSKYIFYFYDKTFVTSYNFDCLIKQSQTKPKQTPYTDMILNCLKDDALSQEL